MLKSKKKEYTDPLLYKKVNLYSYIKWTLVIVD